MLKEKQHWSEAGTIKNLDRSVIGRELAAAVAEQLLKHNGKTGIWFSHRDYCGHGLIFQDRQFRLVVVHDGYATEEPVLKEWKDAVAFVDWLSKQSDFSLSGADPQQKELFTTDCFSLNNQRLTRKRLKDYVKLR